jgi:quercetin dioxygenase-like cupin family protein
VVDVEIKQFERADEIRTFPLGRFELLRIGGTTIGRATYEPGWRWSEHVGAAIGQTSCPVEHLGMVVSGRNLITMDDGRQFEIGPGDIFAIGPGHDSEVVGAEPYVSIHLVGAGGYATAERPG